MGGGASSLASFSCKRKLSVVSIDNEVNDLNKFEEFDFFARLNKGENVESIYVFSKVCGKGYLLSIWNIIRDCESVYCSENDLKSLSLALLPHENEFPMCTAFIKSCDNCNNSNAYAHAMDLLNHIKLRCFRLIIINIYTPYKESPYYREVPAQIVSPDNVVTSNSFDYLNVIAKGGFGLVVQARMKSSKQVYAVKIQPKIDLMNQFRHDKSRITSELAASVVFKHPYLLGLSYAFHTETLTMLVSPISTCGDLHRAVKFCPSRQMSLDRVVFYSAEVISALRYLHTHDIMFRDLKPSNVLLNGDGHIKLTDFGTLSST